MNTHNEGAFLVVKNQNLRGFKWLPWKSSKLSRSLLARATGTYSLLDIINTNVVTNEWDCIYNMLKVEINQISYFLFEIGIFEGWQPYPMLLIRNRANKLSVNSMKCIQLFDACSEPPLMNITEELRCCYNIHECRVVTIIILVGRRTHTNTYEAESDWSVNLFNSIASALRFLDDSSTVSVWFQFK